MDAKVHTLTRTHTQTRKYSDYNAVLVLVRSPSSLCSSESSVMALWWPINKEQENRKQTQRSKGKKKEEKKAGPDGSGTSHTIHFRNDKT